jgi:4-hydroxythreonine-4-phosphate dehydrogenase
MKPLIAVTAGDPAGIGPEIALKAVADPGVRQVCRPLVIGDAGFMRDTARSMTLAHVNAVKSVADARFEPGTVDVLDTPATDLSRLMPGRVQAEAGRAALAWVRRAAGLALAGEVDALCTAPLNKEAVVASGLTGFRGHTEFLGEMCGVPDPLTMFVVDGLKILFLTRHVSLSEAVASVTSARIERFIPLADRALRDIGIESPRIAVAGLNPHSGEGGLFGDEEAREILPAVNRARERGFDVTGPVPADAVFYQARKGKFDAVVSLYHDQGHIAAKTLGFERTVSVTLGLPFVRTSVDHGTAFDIAGRGIASEVSMKEAVKVAAQYAARLRSALPRRSSCTGG